MRTTPQSPVNFPDCCEFHRSAFSRANDWFDKFPFCCDAHQKMFLERKLNKQDFAGIPIKILRQTSYTEYHIAKKIDVTHWLKDITDYIEYNIFSFGQPAFGKSLYLDNVRHFVSQHKEIPQQKLIIDFINGYNKKEDNNNHKFSLNALVETYHKWLKRFPFDTAYFRDIKDIFSQQLPLLASEPITNIYTGLSKAKIFTEDELIESLIDKTKLLLSGINTFSLINKGAISDSIQHKIDLINKQHQLKQNILLESFSKGEKKYVKILKKWLANEYEYFEQISPLFNEISKKLPIDELTQYDNMSEIKNISANNNWDFYYNTQNIRNQSFVLETEQYFETGARKGFLEPLVFMNLFWEQLQYFIKNAHKPYSTLQHFETLRLTAEQKHVLYCFILKFYGGYPLPVSNIDGIQLETTLLLISEAFLRYRVDTPEKEYCRNKHQPKNLNDKLISLEPLPESYKYTAKDFEGFAANNDWDFYHNLENTVEQQHLIFPIKKYFQSGERRGFIEPLAFMNLFWEQRERFFQSQNRTRSFTDSLKTLPINEEVRHVLYAWLLKLTGGYPYQRKELWYDIVFTTIEKAFESYEGKTPEKWFCLREDEREKKINEGIAILDAEIEKEKADLIIFPQLIIPMKLSRFLRFKLTG